VNCRGLIPSFLAVYALAAPGRAVERIVVDLRAGATNARPYRLYGPDAPGLAHPDEQGLRITLPANRREPYREVGAELNIRLRGDFEIAVAYEILSVAEPIPESGAGVQLRAVLDGPVTAAITRLRKPPRPEPSKLFFGVGPFGETFGATRIDHGPDGKEKADVQNFRACASNGRLKMRRTGSVLEYWAADGDGEYRSIRTKEIGTADVTAVRAFGFSGYKPVAVDVRLADLTIEAESFPAVPPAPWPTGPVPRPAVEPPPQRVFAREYRQSLQGLSEFPADWYFFGPDARESVRSEPAGLRFVLHEGGGSDGRPGTGLGIPIFVQGDFDISVDFEILRQPARLRAGPSQTRITLDAVLALPEAVEQVSLATVTRRLLLWDGPQYFTWLRVWDDKAGKHRVDGHGFPATADSGRLRLVRSGSTIAYYVADGPNAPFKLLHQNSFGTGKLRAVQFNAATGGPDAAIDVRLTNLIIRADGLDNVRGDPSRSASRWWLALVALGVMLSLGGCRAYLRRRRTVDPVPVTVNGAGPIARPNAINSSPARMPLLAAALLVIAVYGCSIWANRSLAISDRRELRYIPPFMPFVDANMNRHLGAEYLHIAQSLAAGDGFSSPFPGRTGPTAWMPPVLPAIEAALLRVFDGKHDSVMGAVVFLQVNALILSGLLVMALAQRTAGRVGAWTAAVVFLVAVVCDFHAWFQMTHDAWIVLLALDFVIAAAVWWRPMTTWKTAAAWGFVGGFCALISPIVGFVGGVLTIGFLARSFGRVRSRFAVAALTAGLVVAPWTIRNYAVFGRLIPVKSNAAYELYQSQCLTSDGLIRQFTFMSHPNNPSAGRERQEYQQLGEMAFLDRKQEQFWQSVRNDPQEFLDRVADRLLATTVWYVPFNRDDEARRPVAFWVSWLTYPLPFLAAVFLLGTAGRWPLHRIQWVVLGVYAFYLLPYIAVSFYHRYSAPLVAVNALLVIWAVDRLLGLTFGNRSLAPPVAAAVRRAPGPAAVILRPAEAAEVRP
jgi:hypothetical protein